MWLPNFIIGGALKAGTTSLNHALKQHPDVFMCPIKEPRYFAYDPGNPEHVNKGDGFFPIRTLQEYAALFEGVNGQRAIGEASPHYLLSDQAPKLIRSTIPDVRLIFSLRDPVKRAYSDYWQEVRLGIEKRPVEEAMSEADFRVRIGRYFDQLTPWLERFPRSQIHLVLFDDLQTQPYAVFQDVCRYLGIADDFQPDMTVRNKGGAMKNAALGRVLEEIKRSPIRKVANRFIPGQVRSSVADVRERNLVKPPPIPEAIERRLKAYYDDDILKLEDLLERDLSSWRA
jgi:hypothetical protein